MKIIAIVQARMGSKRLPGKVMMEAGGKPLIGHLVDRLRQCKNLDGIVVAGPMVDQRSALQKYLTQIECDHYFGDEENDLCKRFLSTIALHRCDAFVRICGDSPLIEQEPINLTCKWLRSGADFFSTVGWKMLSPGNSSEGVTVPFYRKLCVNCAPEDREHAGFPYAYRKIAENSGLVDTAEDFERVKRIIENGHA